MAELLPVNFPAPSENSIASYDYFDFASGRAFKRFYPGVADDSSTYQYFLTTQTPVSTYAKRFFENSVANVYVSNDFETVFKNTVTISGQAIISYTLKSAAAGSSTGNAKFEFFRVRNGTPTSIGSVTGPSVALGAGNNYRRLTAVCSLTETDFTVNDTLRVTVSVQNTALSSMGIYCDPASLATVTETTSGLTIPTNLIMEIPFKVQQ